jgi:DNA mismatch endonuclease (patch repair protein)
MREQQTPNLLKPLPPDESVRRRMQATSQRDTPPELALRRALHARGLRYRVDYPPIQGVPRRADIVFRRARVAVFVDGCFWHGCPVHGTLPKKNRGWWIAKLDANRTRDGDTDRQLRAGGWLSLRFWEHDDPGNAADRVLTAVRSRSERETA